MDNEAGSANPMLEGRKPKPRRSMTREEKAVMALRLVLLGAAAAVYSVYCLKHASSFTMWDYLVSFMLLALFTAVAVLSCKGLVHKLTGHSDVLLVTPKRSGRVFWVVCAVGLVLHLLLMVLGAVIMKHAGMYESRLNGFELLKQSWLKGNTDAGHYMNIAENWYVNTEPDNLLLVFFPMLPVLIRLFNLVTHDSFISALIINSLATAFACGMVYLTLTPVMGEKRARFGAFAAILLPGMIFMNSPMSEPLFLLFSVTCFYFIQKRELLLAGVFCALAGFTRSLGVILAVPIAIEGVCYVVQLIKNRKKWKLQLVLTLLALVISTFGTLGYLAINKAVSGEWLRFLYYQKTNWYQEACPFFDTARYVADSLGNYLQRSNASMVTLWAETLTVMFGSLTLIGANHRRLPAIYTWFFLPYFAVSMGCTWLLSAVRYLSAALPVTAAISFAFDKKWKTAVIFAVLLACYIAYMYTYMIRWDVY